MKGKYYRDWLVEDDTVTHCFIEGEIHWDKVDKSDIDLMIINLLQDQDNTEHMSNILFKMHNSSDVADSLGSFLVTSSLADVIDHQKLLRDCALDYLKYLCDMDVDLCEEALELYGIRYAEDAMVEAQMEAQWLESRT